MNKFTPHINPVYPPNNELIFEEWFGRNYTGCNTDRELLPVHFTSYWVNNDYGNNKEARRELNDYLVSLDKSKKYFSIIQYDDGSMIDWRLFGLDVLEFNMSKNIGISMPLLCQPHPYKFIGGKKWFTNFVGSRTHPLRETANQLQNKEGYFISFDRMGIEQYCRIMHESMFTLCYRGYGANSFRLAEAIQYGSIPVYVSDEFILPFGMDFEEFGVLIKSEDAGRIHEILSSIEPEEVIKKQDKLKEVYEKYYTYNGALQQIIKELEAEYNNRQS